MKTIKNPNGIAIITALSARYTLADVRTAYTNQIPLTVYYRPCEDKSKRRIWRGVPTSGQLEALRLMLAAAIGREPTEHLRMPSDTVDHAPDRRSPVGTVYQGYERITTYKWTTPKDIKRPLPPNSLAWRDIITGEVFVKNPFDPSEEKTA